MATFIADDFVSVYRKNAQGKNKKSDILIFGDPVEIVEYNSQKRETKVKVLNRYFSPYEGYVKGKPKTMSKGTLKMSMVDVQQGDGMVLQTPEDKIIIIDGGHNKLFPRHFTARFKYKRSHKNNPIPVDAIIVTHGDADHFDGLNEFKKAEVHRTKRVAIQPKRILHNGLVKRPSSIDEEERLGKTAVHNSKLFITDLVNDPREVPKSQQNVKFKSWTKTIDHWETRAPIDFRRVNYGMDETQVFDFLHDEGIKIDLHGPFTEKVQENGQEVEALPFLHKHAPDPEAETHEADVSSHKYSASHTINGHSIAFRLSYGNVRINFTGDLNEESMQVLDKKLDDRLLKAEILKAPHHGSHEFDFKTLKKMEPIVSLISSGDDSEFWEYMHPRATLLNALGKVSREDQGIIFSTELAAFFKYKDVSFTQKDLNAFFKNHTKDTFTRAQLTKLFSSRNTDKELKKIDFYGFDRTNFGLIELRTDGERVVVFTHSGKPWVKEAYAFTVKMKNGKRVISFEDIKTR
ncbi:ComEC/Rec2 family competence protein [Patiriisocius hiemis]|uniref:MBL fold metallo-hydrolase n=1 Tax=Patiriisocius hiemis TaxID=3075604 RepID=A0ABU2Y8Y5_9FLAO|nr:MBL fold metallo-hydrolase [Constantimarinum sp. W242]MDT0554626.1 MBL fold metallo-hydrolase [Constantimarinum sp. W242]